MPRMKRWFCLMLLAALAVCLSSCGKKEEKEAGYAVQYRNAESLIAEGRYAEAAAELEGLGSYEEATRLSMYCRAVEAGENGDFATAFTTFEYLNGYRDSELMLIYYTARQHQAQAGDGIHEPAEENLSAASVYLRIPLFRDSRERADSCTEAAYEYAKSMAAAGRYEDAVYDFGLLEDYRDSRTLSLKAQADALYDRGDLIGAYLIYRGLEPEYQTHAADYEAKYRAAAKLLEDGEYGEARTAFLELGEYQDCADKAVECRYLEASALLKNGKFKEAAQIFTALGGYRDSEALLAEAKADSLYAGGDPAGAWEIYQTLDEAYRIHDRDYETLYEAAARELDEKKYDEAAAHFRKLGGYGDAAEQAVKCRLAKAEALEAEGKYSEAAALYAKLGRHEKADACRYQYGLQLLSGEKYAEAAEEFALCGAYQDSRQQHYEAGIRAFGAGRLREAFEILKDDQNTEAARAKIYEIAAAASEGQDYELSTEAYRFLGVYQEAVLEEKMDSYRWGSRLYEQGDFDGSAAVFASLGDFSTAPEKVREAGYAAAKDKMDKGEYSGAREYLASLGDYKDCRQLLKECNYQLTAEAWNAGQYQRTVDAAARYGLAGYRDMDEMLRDSHYHLGLAAENKGEYLSAIDEYEASGAFADSAEHITECSFRHAVALKEEGDVGSAVEWLVKARKHPEAIAQVERIIVYCETTEQQAAAENAAQNILLIRAENAMDDGDYKAATEYYTQITDPTVAKPREKEAWYFYGEELMNGQLYAEAAEAFAAAGDYPGAREERNRALVARGDRELAAGNYGQARVLYAEAQDDNRVRECWALEADALLAEKDYEGARSAYAQAELPEKVKEAWKLEADALLAEKNYEGARSAYTRAELPEKVREAWQTEADALLAEKKYADARSVYTEAGMPEKVTEVWQAEAEEYLAAGQYEEARNIYAQAELPEKVKEVWALEAEALLAENKYAEARAAYAEAGMADKVREVRQQEAEALLAEGKYQEAQKAFLDVDNQARYEDAVFEEAKALMDAGDFGRAYALLNGIPGHEGVADLLTRSEFAPFRLERGKTTTFGSYEQDNNTGNGAEPIEWLVLDVEEDRALLISQYGLDVVPYNQKKQDVGWDKSSVRQWLNGEFLNTAFSDSERSLILEATVPNGKGQAASVSQDGKDTQDYVFLLSSAETNKYMKSTLRRKCEPTAYARAKGAEISPKCGTWLMRTRYYNTKLHVEAIDAMGSYTHVAIDNARKMIRPVIWVKMK